MAIAPKKIHFIWVGTPIHDKYIANIQEWQRRNPDYKVHLWIDSASVPADLLDLARDKAAQTGAKIMDLADNVKDFLNDPETTNADLYNEEVTGQFANYAAASDILRLEICSI